MMPLDFDMELLRLVGALRTRIAELDAAAELETLAQHVNGLLDRARESTPVAVEPLEAFGESFDRAVIEGADVRTDCVSVLEALEGVIVESDSSEWKDALAARLTALAEKAGKGDVGDGSASEAAGGSEASLNGVAHKLIQLEPTIFDSFVTLREHFAKAIASWSGSDEIRAQLQDALQALDTVVVDRDAEESIRLEVVEQVGHALEIAMMEEEEAALAAAGSEGPEASRTVDAVEDEDAAEGVAVADAEASEESAVEAVEAEPVSRPDPAVSQAPAAGGSAIELSADSDPELVVEFVAEGLDYLDQAEAALLALEADPSDAEAVNVTFRAFHTIKGVSAFLGLDQVTSVAHHAETLLAQVRSGTLAFTGTAADLFLRSADVLRALITGVREVARGASATVPAAFDVLMEQLTDPTIGEQIAEGAVLTATGSRATASAAAAADATDRAGGAGDARVVTTAQDESVRIRTERLDRLVDLVGELVVAHSMIAQDSEVVASRDNLSRKVAHSQKIMRELQNLSTSLRMVPLKPAFHKISRVVRDVSHKSGKTVELITTGDDTELDRSMVGVVTDPLVHMVRNAVDHGIESAEEREAAGKPSAGTLKLSARQTGGNVVVEIEDDGRGLDREKILAKAVERGLVDPERTLDDSEVFKLIFQPGFSTAKKVTNISGRGVGMDVVKRAIESLRGRVEIRSEAGKGTRFSIYLPLTLAITDGMLVEVGSQRYIVPTQKIHQSFRPTEDELWSVASKGEMVMHHEQLIPIARLHRLYDVEGAVEEVTEGLLVVVGEGSRKTALLVDHLLGQQQFVVKALSGPVASTPGVAGGAILGDGAVGLILDPDEIVELARTGGSTRKKTWNAA